MQHFPAIQLTFEEARVLGCLLEKETLTPGSYPLTLNSLVTACNQSSSREPVTSLSADDVEEALRSLSEKYLVEKILGGRTPKYEHCLPHVLSLQDSERAVLTVLLLRGQQSAGEIKQRTERLHHFNSLDEVEETLSWFIEYPHGPLVKRLPVGAGRRVETFRHLLSETPDEDGPAEEGASTEPEGTDEAPAPPVPSSTGEDDDWRAEIEQRLARLEHEVMTLRSRINS